MTPRPRAAASDGGEIGPFSKGGDRRPDVQPRRDDNGLKITPMAAARAGRGVAVEVEDGRA
jgi:hypothetical protein